MRQTIVTLFTAAILAAPLAQAETTPITVEISYDSDSLASETGAKALLRSIKAQATEACAFENALMGMPAYDRECRADLIAQAIGQIKLAAAARGQSATYVFASLESDNDPVQR